jgi:acetolactate synthase-1/2/3 large subunit
MERVIGEVLAKEGPFLIDIRIPEEEDVLPMVPSGARLDQMIMGG